MKITAKLAYSQLKTNRSRTTWTLIGIALSTALITAVCSFVASRNSMLVGVFGADYGLYGQSFVGLLLIPAIFSVSLLLPCLWWWFPMCFVSAQTSVPPSLAY